ncbi:interferon-inducible double-stranded RNA-dependent protein kinase activator A homolog [Leptopilina boulardi]|uniref:interferon-inducible double-stranded RNA-dependent protein kinase activator A homolog n=1 Tax=Leptopilina boulardi TaxID=63433 RepID=UPI0021F628E7|nr:interferon-inducible double-stranded RNA-dependent protein kinase activator A homolog [Leptopilina boulardi]
MNKTPVSILQEMMMKEKCVPNYELIFDGGGTHDNTFTYQVTCDGFMAIGTGRCKKDAKHEAAKEMLEKIAAHRAYPQLQESPAPSPARRPLLTETTVSPKRPSNLPFLNAIGALAQLCVDNNLQQPEYKEVDDVGPPHARVFTISCIVSSFQEEGIATTKKQAKHEAARKMLEKIQIVVEDLRDSGEIDIRCDDAKLLETNANELALEKYSTLTKLPQKKINLGVKLDDYHRHLKKSYDEETRCEILKELKSLDELIKTCNCDVTEEFVNELKVKFIEFLKPLYLTYCSVELDTNSKTEYAVAVEISTNPDIVGIGIADFTYKAERNAIYQIINNLICLFS